MDLDIALRQCPCPAGKPAGECSTVARQQQKKGAVRRHGMKSYDLRRGKGQETQQTGNNQDDNDSGRDMLASHAFLEKTEMF